MKIYLSVCKNTVRANIGKPRSQQTPPIRISRGKYGKPKRVWAFHAVGEVKVVYDDQHPLPWGARAWVEYES